MGILDYIDVAGLIAALGLLWKLASRLATIETLLTEVMDNHLPHIEDEIKTLRTAFTTHLERRAK